MSMHNDPTEMMAMESAIPEWLTPVAWIYVAVGVLSAAVVLYDFYGRRYRQSERMMEIVWPITALYLGPFALWAYYRLGRAGSPKWQQENGALPEQRLSLKALAGGTPGGAAATVAHVIGVPLVIASGLTIAGIKLWVLIIVIALLAIAILFFFERFASPVWGEPQARKGTGAALLAATVTVLAFDIGMGGWMIFLHFGMFMPAPTDVTFLFLMGIGNILGFATAYPAVRWLIQRGVKDPVLEAGIPAFSARGN
ncbi:DUF4396 domain-containing protein [Pseudarthrobacter raffinosi]|uniref:DUF4396 domain-containing protein n=1 Tax=Pseudarthrobacter raffinosi TaxID=2953651 RepID=UPI00208F776F|nr:DUF4396 domain-containing protein [Pseudarthrobacter sp. MDT3-28]MCO4239197.1 DUF4396 domain-containing protein [Pseudarthrobacter sp. MDT3-28]